MALRTVVCVVLCSYLAVPTALAQTGAGKPALKRGEMLSVFGGCNDCHTPKIMTAQGPAPDQSRLLSGHPANAPLTPIPQGVIGTNPNQWAALTNGDLTAWAGPWGVSFAANLTPGTGPRTNSPRRCGRVSTWAPADRSFRRCPGSTSLS